MRGGQWGGGLQGAQEITEASKENIVHHEYHMRAAHRTGAPSSGNLQDAPEAERVLAAEGLHGPSSDVQTDWTLDPVARDEEHVLRYHICLGLGLCGRHCY